MKSHAARIVLLVTGLLFFATAFQNCSEAFAPMEGLEAVFASGAPAPQLTFGQSPKRLDNARAASFTFQFDSRLSSIIASIECRLDGAAPTDCTTGRLDAAGLVDGPHSLVITITDFKGMRAEYPAWEWTVDATAPVTTFTAGPGAFINTKTSSLSFSISDPGVTKVECQLNEGPFAECQSPVALDALVDGPQTFQVKVTDAAGNEAIAVKQWSVDTIAPALVINSAPTQLFAARASSVAFAATDAGSGIASYDCIYDNNATAACTSPFQLSSMTDGAHSVRIRARDIAGNYSSFQTSNWTVDTTAPLLVLTPNVSAITNSTSASFSFSGSDSGKPLTNFQCVIDNAMVEACTSPKAYSGLAQGSHTFTLVGVDAAGNASSPSSFSFTVDTEAPTVTIQSPVDATNQRTVSFDFTSSDFLTGIASTECALNGGAFTPCVSPVTYANLPLGRVFFAVRVFDRAGNSAVANASTEIVPSLVLANTITTRNTNGELVHLGTALYTGLDVIDVSNRVNPAVTPYQTGIVPHKISVVDSTLAQLSSNFLELYSLATPLAPARTAQISLQNFPSGTVPQFTRAVHSTNDYLFACWGDYSTQSEVTRIGVWDLTGTPKAVAEVFAKQGPPSYGNPYNDGIGLCAIDKDFVYVRRARSTVVYPISRAGIGAPRVFDYAGYVFGEPVGPGYFVASDIFEEPVGKARLKVFSPSVSGDGLLAKLDLRAPPSLITVSNGYLVVLLGIDGFAFEVRVYDMAVPVKPKLVGIGKSPAMIFGVDVQFPYVYGKGKDKTFIFNVN